MRPFLTHFARVRFRDLRFWVATFQLDPDTALDGQKRKHTALHHIRNARYCISSFSSFSRVNATRVLAKASRGRATPSELESFISVWRVCSYAYVHNHWNTQKMIRLFIVTDLKIYKHVLLRFICHDWKFSFCQSVFSFSCGEISRKKCLLTNRPATQRWRPIHELYKNHWHFGRVCI